MQIEIEKLNRSGLEKFADAHGLVMQVIERATAAPDRRYYAKFKDSEVSGPGFLVGEFGDGPTPEAAIEDYARQIRGVLLVIDAFTVRRRDIQCPNEWAAASPAPVV